MLCVTSIGRWPCEGTCPTAGIVLFMSLIYYPRLALEAVSKAQAYTDLSCDVGLHMHKPANFNPSLPLPPPSHPCIAKLYHTPALQAGTSNCRHG